MRTDARSKARRAEVLRAVALLRGAGGAELHLHTEASGRIRLLLDSVTAAELGALAALAASMDAPATIAQGALQPA